MEQLGIYANKTLITFYFFFWIGAALCITTNAITAILNDKVFRYMNVHVWLSMDICDSIYCVFALALNCTILATYMKFSNRIGRKTAKSAT